MAPRHHPHLSPHAPWNASLLCAVCIFWSVRSFPYAPGESVDSRISLDNFQQLEKTLQLKQHALDEPHSGQLIPSKFRWAMVLEFA
jgi:hypothetical protein